LFSKKFYAFCAAFLMMFDFMHFAQSRISTIDIYGTFFVILMYYFMYDYFTNKSTVLGFRKSLITLFITGVFFGMGSASKWIGLYAGGGLALLLFMTKYYEIKDYINIKMSLLKNKKFKKPEWFDSFFTLNISATLLSCIIFFVIIPGIIYALSYIPYMNVPGPGHGLDLIFRNQRDMYIYHSKGVLGATHPFSSHWWEWPLLRRPLESYVGGDLPSGASSSMVIMGNPAIWWVGIFAVLIVSILAFIKYKKKMIPAIISGIAMILIIAGTGPARNIGVFALAIIILILVTKFDKKLGVIFVAMAFQFLPWVPIERLSFIYHFFSTLPFMILTIVYVIKLVMEKAPESKLMIYTYLGIVALLFIMFYPVLSGMEVPRDYVTHWLLWFKDKWVF
jgi:dolichyl-phosphate-mannose-protein mannosyltransferase